LFTFENSGVSLWTGGEFGPEGGLVGTIVLLLTFLVMTGVKAFKEGISFQKIIQL